MRTAILPLALFAVACSGGEASDTNATRSDGGGSAAAAQQRVPANLTDDPRNEVLPTPLPSPTAASGIPAAFQGRWGMVPNDCTSTRGDNKGLLTITGGALTFYESRAVADSIEMTGRDQLSATMEYVGEGMHWTKPTILTLSDGGRTLVRDERNPGAVFRYSRCPA